MQEAKLIWQSKTFWLNLIAIVALVLQTYTGFIIDPEKQVVILGIVNTILRFITKTPINWGGVAEGQQGFASIRFLLAVVMAIALMMLVSGCATGVTAKRETPQSIAAKTLLSSHQAVKGTAVTVDELCSQGIMKQASCTRARELYAQAQAAWFTSTDAYLLYLISADAAAKDRYEKSLSGLQALIFDLDGLVTTFKGAPSAAPAGGK